MIFAKKPKPEPTRQELADEYRRKIAEAVSDAQAKGVDVYGLSVLTDQVEALRRWWPFTAPLGTRMP
jgi:hypothetical protein